ncbi:MFS transporter [Nocardiopsis coralliicola]
MTEPSTAPSGAPARADRRAWAGLALLVAPMLMLSTDLTVLFFALPTIAAELDPSATQALWIVHVYGFLIAGFLVTMGRLGDRIGPRRLLLSGAAAFGVLSAAAAFATGPEALLVLRGLLGIAGAALMPPLFSLLRLMFSDDGQRRAAIAIMFSAFSVGGAVGPLLGGALLEYFWWGSVFLINTPVMLVLLACGPLLLPERPAAAGTAAARIDAVSIALSVAGMLALVYGLQEAAAGQEAGSGAAAADLAAAGAGAALLALFGLRQRRLADPLFDLRLLADPRIAAGLGAVLLTGIGVVGVFYLFTQFLQWGEGISPLAAGVWTLPYIAVNIAGALAGPALAGRYRPAAVVAGGLGAAAAGAALIAVPAVAAGPLPVLVAAFAFVGLGQGMAMALVSDLIIASAPEEKTGSAAAAQEVCGELGTALGIAIGGAVSMVAYRAFLPGALPAGVPAAAEAAARSSVHEGAAAAEALPGAAGADLLGAVQSALTAGLQVYAAVAAPLALAAAVLVAAVLLRRAPGRKAEA